MRIVKLGQPKQFVECYRAAAAEKKRISEKSNQEVEDKTRTVETVDEMVEAVEKGEKSKGLGEKGRDVVGRGKRQKKKQKVEMGEECDRGRADWLDGRWHLTLFTFCVLLCVFVFLFIDALAFLAPTPISRSNTNTYRFSFSWLLWPVTDCLWTT